MEVSWPCSEGGGVMPCTKTKENEMIVSAEGNFFFL